MNSIRKSHKKRHRGSSIPFSLDRCHPKKLHRVHRLRASCDAVFDLHRTCTQLTSTAGAVLGKCTTTTAMSSQLPSARACSASRSATPCQFKLSCHVWLPRLCTCVVSLATHSRKLFDPRVNRCSSFSTSVFTHFLDVAKCHFENNPMVKTLAEEKFTASPLPSAVLNDMGQPTREWQHKLKEQNIQEEL